MTTTTQKFKGNAPGSLSKRRLASISCSRVEAVLAERGAGTAAHEVQVSWPSASSKPTWELFNVVRGTTDFEQALTRFREAQPKQAA